LAWPVLGRIYAGTEIASRLNMHGTWNRRKTTFISRHYLHNRSTSNTGMFGYINVIEPEERSPEVWKLPTATSYSIPQGNELWTKHLILILFNNTNLFSSIFLWFTLWSCQYFMQYGIKWCEDWQTGKDCDRKQSWINSGTTPAFIRMDWEKNSSAVEWNQQTRNHVSWLHLYMHWKHCFNNR